MVDLFRYAAFISYSSKDAAFARRLHGALERYTIPASLGHFDVTGGGKRNRIYPVFRDREELAAGELGERIEASLKASAALIVVCSPDAAASRWVQKEIEFFVELGRKDHVFAIICDRAPRVDDKGADATALSLPPVLRGDVLSNRAALEPLAGDARAGKDGFRKAYLKVIAGMIGVNAGALEDRDRRRRRARLRLTATGAVAAFALSSAVLSSIEETNARAAFSAEARSRMLAQSTLDGAPWAVAGVASATDVLALAPVLPGAEETSATLASTGFGLRRLASFDPGGPLGEIEAHYAPDGSRVALNTDRTSTVFDTNTGAVVIDVGPALKPGIGDAQTQGFSDDSARYVSFFNSEAAALWDARLGKKLIDLAYAGAGALSPDGLRLAALEGAGKAVLWDAHLGRKLGDLAVRGVAKDVVVSPAGKALLVRTTPRLVTEGDADWVATEDHARTQLFAASDGRWLASLGVVARAEFSADDARLLVIRADKAATSLSSDDTPMRAPLAGAFHTLGAGETADVVDPKSGKTLVSAPGANGALLSRDGSLFVSTTANTTTTVWDAHDGRQIAILQTGAVKSLFLSPSGAVLIALNDTGAGAIWDPRRPAMLGPLASAADVIFSPPGARAVVRDRDGNAALWDVQKGARLAVLGPVQRTRRGQTIGVEFSPDGARLLTETDHTAKLWDAATGRMLADLDAAAYWGFFERGTRLVTAESESGKASLWNSITGRRLSRFSAAGPIERVDWAPRGSRIATTGKDGAALLWDARSGALLAAIAPRGMFTTRFADARVRFAPDGASMTTSDGALWDAAHASIGAHPVVALRGAALRSHVCEVNGAALGVFPASIRDAHARVRPDLYAAPKGRPWRPCDWVGLAGGPEGWAQWLRRLEVLYLAGEDYACAARTATGKTDGLSRQQCAPSAGADARR